MTRRRARSRSNESMKQSIPSERRRRLLRCGARLPLSGIAAQRRPPRPTTARCCRSRRCRRPARRRHACRIPCTSAARSRSISKPGAPNVLIILLDDVGFGQASTFGGEIEHADAHQAREPGHQLQHVPHHVDLLADARGAAHRAQSPARRQRHDRRTRGRLGRLHRRDPEDLGDDGRSAAALRLQDGRLRQVAQHAGRPDHGDGAVRPLADRARLRLLLRLPRRRDVAVGTAAGREHQRRSSRRTTRSTT